jgi:hypothetical protein
LISQSELCPNTLGSLTAATASRWFYCLVGARSYVAQLTCKSGSMGVGDHGIDSPQPRMIATSSCLVNAVESFFSKLIKQQIKRGMFQLSVSFKRSLANTYSINQASIPSNGLQPKRHWPRFVGSTKPLGRRGSWVPSAYPEVIVQDRRV